MDHFLLIMSTTSDEEEAKKISDVLVNEKLAACVNIISDIRSIYFWKEEICDDHECLLIIKSKKSLLDQIISRIKQIHSYENPEIIALPIAGGSKEYLNWLEKNTQ